MSHETWLDLHTTFGVNLAQDCQRQLTLKKIVQSVIFTDIDINFEVAETDPEHMFWALTDYTRSLTRVNSACLLTKWTTKQIVLKLSGNIY